jgi:hypothetical protein
VNKYGNTFALVRQVCFVSLVTSFVAASASAQTASTPAKTNSGGGPPLVSVAHDATLQGDGTTSSPLSIPPSPKVSGSLSVGNDIQAKNVVSANSTVNGVLTVSGNIQASAIVDDLITVDFVIADHILADARDTSFSDAIRGGGSSIGIQGRGGVGISPDGFHVPGGFGVVGTGGFPFVFSPTNRKGGVGVTGKGGDGLNGGVGVKGDGGNTDFFTGSGGVGLSAQGGKSGAGNGGIGVVATGRGALETGNSGGTGVFAAGGPANFGASKGLAADFDGSVLVSGKVIKGSGSFKIDHPLDPGNKYLSHSFVESPDMMNIYNGVITTDSNGDAVVQLPEYFGALNRDFRYQLTVIRTFAKSTVAEKITDNHFRIKTSLPNVKVSWQVTGIRQDAYANRNRISVEEDKPESERGLYLHPEAFGQSPEKSILQFNKSAKSENHK